MARPRKTGLVYFYKGVNEWNHYVIRDLVGKYGPMGYCVYDVIRCMVYESGYYLEISLDKLAVNVVWTIGNRWIKDKSFVLQVIEYCAEIGLFDRALLRKSVVTSAEIQEHYSEVTARSKADKSRFWLLDEVADASDDCPAEEPDLPADDEFAAKTAVFTAKTPINSAKNQQRKENKRKEKQIKSNKITSNEVGCADHSGIRNDDDDDADDIIEDVYYSVTGRHFRRADIAALDEMRSFGADDSTIIRAIEDTGRRGYSDISSMKYFLPIVRQAVNRNAVSPHYPQYKSNEEFGRCPPTSNTAEVEEVLDAEFMALIRQYANRTDEVIYDDGDDFKR